MHTGAFKNYADDNVTKETLLFVRKLMGKKDNTHEQRLFYLAPMLTDCSDAMLPLVMNTIEESERRETYRVCRILGIKP